jgi:hypothetical protein
VDKSVITRAVTVAGGRFAPGHLGELTQQVPFEMVDAVLEQTCRVQRRVRDLPARVTVYLLLAGCLFAELGYAQVWHLCRSKIGSSFDLGLLRFSGGSLVFVDQAAEDRFSADLARAGVCWSDAGSGARVLDALVDALMWPGGVVTLPVLSQDCAQVCLVQDQGPVEELAARGADWGSCRRKARTTPPRACLLQPLAQRARESRLSERAPPGVRELGGSRREAVPAGSLAVSPGETPSAGLHRWLP